MFLLLFYHFFFSLNKDSCSIVSSKLHEAYITYFMGETDTRNWHSAAGRYTQFSWILILHIAKYNVIYRAHLTAPAKVSPHFLAFGLASELCCPQQHTSQGWGGSTAAPWHTAGASTMSTINQVTDRNCLHLFLLSFSIFAIVGQNSETAD